MKNVFTGGVDEPPLLRMAIATGAATSCASLLVTPGEIVKVRVINDL
jgi:hypothetical protein